MTYRAQRRWADALLPEISRLLAAVFVCPAPDYRDMHEATDLMVLTVRPFDVACRVRKFHYWTRPQWRQEFTIRSSLPSGAKTEWDKITEGWGDFMFYGFADESGTRLHEARILNLNVFRAAHIRGTVPFLPVPNEDGTEGRAYSLASFPSDLIFKHWTPDELQPAAQNQHDVDRLERENEELRARLEYLQDVAAL